MPPSNPFWRAMIRRRFRRQYNVLTERGHAAPHFSRRQESAGPLQIFEEGRPIPGDDYNEARHGPSPSGRCTGGGHGALSWHARTDSTAAFRRTSASLIPRIDVG